MTVTWKKLAYEDDVITKALLTAKGSLITASGAGTPLELVIGTDTYILAVATDTPGWIDPTSLPVASHSLDDHTVAVADVDFGGFEATDFCLQNSVAPPVTPILGKIYFDSDLSPYVCTSIA